MALIGKNNIKNASSLFNKKELRSGDLIITEDNRCMLYISDSDWRTKYKLLCFGPKGHEGIAVMPSSLRVESQTYVDIPNRYDDSLKCKDYPNLNVVKIYKKQIEISKRTIDDWFEILEEFTEFIKTHGYMGY